MLLVATVLVASAHADDSSLIVGHWRYENGGCTIDHYFEKDGRYKWVMAQDGEEGASSRGTYKLVDGVLQLYRDFLPLGKLPIEWRYTVDANNFTIIGGLNTNEKIENMVSKRVLDKK